jgi:vitamin B12 transporter
MYLRKLVCSFVVICFFSSSVFAQVQLSGRVTDGKTLLEGVSVVVLKSRDSTYVSGALTDSSGVFSVRGLNAGTYRFLFSMIGYSKKSLTQEINGSSDVRLNDVILEEEFLMMNTVTVKGRRPPFELEAGKTTVNVSSAALGSDGSVLNVLGKIPGVLILNDGTVLLNGQAGANVMIDDKLTYLTGENLVNLLRSIPTSAVDKIELVSQPSARYDANGTSGFINIQRKKKADRGLNFTISSNMETGRRFRQNQSTSVSFHRDKMSLYVDYSFYKGKDFMWINSSRKYFDEGLADSSGLRLDMRAKRQFDTRSHYLKSGIDYEFLEKLSAGVHLYSNWFRREKAELATSDFFYLPEASDSTLSTGNIQTTRHQNLSGGANLLYKPTKKFKWDTAFSFLIFDQDDELDQSSRFQKPDELARPDTLSGLMGGQINIYNVQSNWKYEASESLTLSFGLKSSWVSINNKALYQVPQSGGWQVVDKLSSGFVYQESIRAAYVQVNRKWSSKLSAEAGLRFEHTGTRSDFTSSSQDSLLHRSYPNLFPTFSTRYALNNKHVISFQYGRRIIRPNYRDLNPFTEVNDRFLQMKGNTRLNPELTDHFEGSWLLHSQYAFSVFYANRKSPIAQSYLVDPGTKTAIVMPLNLSVNHSAGFRASLNSLEPATWWTAHLNLTLTYKEFHWLESDKKETNRLFAPTMQVSNQFSLPHKWALEVTGYYNGRIAEGQARIGPFGAISMGVRKSLWENKLSLYIYANDIFLTNRPRIDLRNGFIAGSYNERRDSRMAGVTLMYRFSSGNMFREFRKQESTEESKRVNL